MHCSKHHCYPYQFQMAAADELHEELGSTFWFHTRTVSMAMQLDSKTHHPMQ
jgi:hypothetical protein